MNKTVAQQVIAELKKSEREALKYVKKFSDLARAADTVQKARYNLTAVESWEKTHQKCLDELALAKRILGSDKKE